MLTDLDTTPIWLTLRLAVITTLLLLLISLPLSWWLSFGKSRLRPIVGALVSLPLVLPPTVLGFYLLLLLGPKGYIGQFTHWLGFNSLAFTFSGLVVASILYSLPFAVQPIQNAFKAIDKRSFEVAATLGANAFDRFVTIALPLAKSGMLSAMILTFAHTMGEFGVVLMIGGNIPGETQVLSMALYEHVETQEYQLAHYLAAGMLGFSFIVLLCVQFLGHNKKMDGL